MQLFGSLFQWLIAFERTIFAYINAQFVHLCNKLRVSFKHANTIIMLVIIIMIIIVVVANVATVDVDLKLAPLTRAADASSFIYNKNGINSNHNDNNCAIC